VGWSAPQAADIRQKSWQAGRAAPQPPTSRPRDGFPTRSTPKRGQPRRQRRQRHARNPPWESPELLLHRSLRVGESCRRVASLVHARSWIEARGSPLGDERRHSSAAGSDWLPRAHPSRSRGLANILETGIRESANSAIVQAIDSAQLDAIGPRSPAPRPVPPVQSQYAARQCLSAAISYPSSPLAAVGY